MGGACQQKKQEGSLEYVKSEIPVSGEWPESSWAYMNVISDHQAQQMDITGDCDQNLSNKVGGLVRVNLTFLKLKSTS